MNQLPPSPGVFHDRFQIFQKFAEIFASQGAPLVSTTPVANLLPASATSAANFSIIFASVVDTGGKYRWKIRHWCQRRVWQIATGINDTGSNFATGVNDTGGK
jgi:hypothetical protein